MRAVALYFAFAGNGALSGLASSARRQAIAKARRGFPLASFRGVDGDCVAKLQALGIGDVEQLLAAGRTAQAREDLAAWTGVTPSAILELAKLSDLSRIPGLKAVRARLYHDAGADTPVRIAEFVQRTGFEGIAPLPKEVSSTVTAARKLPKVVEY